jgi:hypothetical protein
MACARCGKKSSDGFTPASTRGADAATRPRPALRQRPVTRTATRQGRFGDPIQPAQQPAPPQEG